MLNGIYALLICRCFRVCVNITSIYNNDENIQLNWPTFPELFQFRSGPQGKPFGTAAARFYRSDGLPENYEL